ncbi:L-aminoadipate-semialdehyde dehydrogenase [Obba rivulosa]|uniref:L-aminoadipate-semialdehyde dehydrogenase n=1 Tax=Obba rivulosa TaxID=1052685 RepID=A0A8E2DJ09_9APHY|nr:L-aminoadipate-semialdehyde dehydrogenase [Obba rivulosa]
MSSLSGDLMSVTELLHMRASQLPDQTAFYTEVDEPGSPLRSLTYSEVLQAVDRLCAHYAVPGMLLESTNASIPPQQTIAVLTIGSIDLALLQLALVKLGLSPLLLSTNNSVPAIAHLCKATSSTHLVYAAKFAANATEVQKLLAEQGYNLGLVKEKQFPLWGPEGISATVIQPYAPRLPPQQEQDRIVVILHSSGSTGFPKTVAVSHRKLIGIAIAIKAPLKSAFSILPIYHSFGYFNVFRSFYDAVPMTLFSPHLPLTAQNMCRVIQASPTRCMVCVTVPYVIKLLAESEEGMRALADFDVVSFSGAAFPDELGDRLSAAGVNLLSSYGSTEAACLLSSARDFKHDKGWNWLRAEGAAADYIVMEERGAGTFELIVRDGWPGKNETNRPDGSYATKDLFIRHGQHPSWYRYVGRQDDTIVQLLGEKTNPVPIELSIRGNSPYIAEVIVFGAGRPQIGCLILPSDLGKELSEDRDTFMAGIWPAIARANAEAPSHSQLLPEMIHILPYGTEVPLASKLSILRPACYVKFKDIIDDVYSRYEHGGSGPKLDLTESELEEFIHDTFLRTLGCDKAQGLDRDVDVFTFGVDSLQAARIRNICQAELDLRGHQLTLNVVYEYPTIQKLADHIISIKRGSGGVQSDSQQYALMTSMVEKWCGKFEGPSTRSEHECADAGPHTVLLTGATGFLGAHILQQLVVSSTVAKVICLARAEEDQYALSRVKQSLRTRQLMLSPEHIAKVECLAASVNEKDLGLDADAYARLTAAVTIVIHNAWPVNFLLGVDSFEEQMGGVVNLINLCLRSNVSRRPRFFFSSSIASQMMLPDTVDEAFSQSPTTAPPTGYAQSKWVAEKICERAANMDIIDVGVLRIGQLAGDTVNGIWNETESWPLMIKSVDVIGALPTLDEELSFLPVDLAGRSIAEIVQHPGLPRVAVYHIVNPVLTSWGTMLAGLKSAELAFNVVDKAQWLALLENSDPSPERNPTMKLLPFFRKQMAQETTLHSPRFLVDRTSQLSGTVAACGPVGESLVCKWVRSWRVSGFIKSKAEA